MVQPLLKNCFLYSFNYFYKFYFMIKLPINSIDRFSVVKYEGQIYVLENSNKRKPLLIKENDKGERIGKQMKTDTLLEVVYYPAQLAFLYLQSI